jgi:flagellar biosynthesis anti-sigma factor FlgM
MCTFLTRVDGRTAVRLVAVDNSDQDETRRDEQALEQEVNKYQEVAKSLPEARRQRIEELKRLIQSGQYHIDSQKIADKILERQPGEDLF